MSLIEKLAVELGQSTEAIWDSLVKQAGIAARLNLCIAFFMYLIIVGLVILSVYMIKIKEEDSGIVAIVTAVVLFLISLAFLIPGLTAAYNPEYWAFKELTYLLK